MSYSGSRQPRHLFPQRHIPHILSAILRVDIHKETENEREVPITERLCKKLKGTPWYRNSPLRIEREQPIVSLDPESGKRISGRVDILVSREGETDAETYFAIEAKRLRYHYPGGDFEKGNDDYVGEDGMMRFVTGKYAPHMKTGAMLGYVFDGDTEAAWSGIGALIREKIDMLRMTNPKDIIPFEILPGKRIGETRHLRMSNRGFIIYHLFISLWETAI